VCRLMGNVTVAFAPRLRIPGADGLRWLCLREATADIREFEHQCPDQGHDECSREVTALGRLSRTERGRSPQDPLTELGSSEGPVHLSNLRTPGHLLRRVMGVDFLASV